jgi:hypothetical protein
MTILRRTGSRVPQCQNTFADLLSLAMRLLGAFGFSHRALLRHFSNSTSVVAVTRVLPTLSFRTIRTFSKALLDTK